MKKYQQHGAALLVALVALLVISLIGISALKMSGSDSRISTSAQAKVHSFNAAESAINEIVNMLEYRITDLTNNSSSEQILDNIIEEIGDDIWEFCLKGTETTNSACASSEYLDANKQVKSSAKVSLSQGFLPMPGWSLNGSIVFGMKEMTVVGYGEVPSFEIKSVNVQGLGFRGPQDNTDLRLDD